MADGASAIARRVQKQLKDEADRRNSAYDRYGMNNTPESVNPDVWKLTELVLKKGIRL